MLRYLVLMMVVAGCGLSPVRAQFGDVPVDDLGQRKLAESGDAEAQFQMGLRLLRGMGTAKPDAAEGAPVRSIRGKTLLDLAQDDYSDAQTLVESKALMRRLINHHLAGQPLQSRRVFIELQEL